MARKRRARKNTGLFDVPDQPHDDSDRAGNSDSAGNSDGVGVFGGPTHDSRVLGGPGHYTGLFDAPDRAPGEMPGLFDRPARVTGKETGKPGDGRERSVGLFDKPRREGRT